MTCRYCNNPLSPLRSLIDGEFCSDGHRMAFQSENPGSFPAVERPVEEAERVVRARVASDRPVVAEPVVAEPEDALPVAEALLPLELRPVAAAIETEICESVDTVEFRVSAPMVPYVEFEPINVMPDLASLERAAEPMAAEPAASATLSDPVAATTEPSRVEAPAAFEAREAEASLLSRSLNWVAGAWRAAPLDLKIITLCLPIMLAVAVSGSRPKMKFTTSATAGNVQQAMSEKWKVVQQNIADRAAVAYTDDFRTGLDSWDSKSNLTTSWSYDATGFVQPGPLAVFKPSMDMTDYRFGFLGEIDNKALGFVFRAADLNNYYAIKFAVVRPGPLPLVDVVRYAVINGKEGPHVEKPLPITVHADMLYRVMVDVRGGDFTIMAQDQVVDFWSDHRLQKGGVGFFCNRGEKARVRWVEVSHQYDALGKLCAFVAPYGMQSSTD